MASAPEQTPGRHPPDKDEAMAVSPLAQTPLPAAITVGPVPFVPVASTAPTAPFGDQPLPARLEVPGLGTYDANRLSTRSGNKRRRGDPLNPSVLGTPRSSRMFNLFPEVSGEPTLSESIAKLGKLMNDAIVLPANGATSIKVESEAAANLKTLMVTILELEASADRPNPKKADNVPRESSSILASNPAFNFRAEKAEIASLTVAVAAITKHLGVRPTAPTSSPYALAASKHAHKNAGTTSAPAVPITKPNTNQAAKASKPPVHKQPVLRTANTITLSQLSPDVTALAKFSLREIIHTTNSLLSTLKLKVQDSDEEILQMKAAHRHPSRDIVLYTENFRQAEGLKKKVDLWLPGLSKDLVFRPKVHAIFIHGVPTSFNPAIPSHLEDLYDWNPATMTQRPAFVKWKNNRGVQVREF